MLVEFVLRSCFILRDFSPFTKTRHPKIPTQSLADLRERTGGAGDQGPLILEKKNGKGRKAGRASKTNRASH